MRRAAPLAIATALCLACSHLPRPLPRLADCPGSLVPTQEIEGDWRIHERIRVRGERIDEAYGLVVQKTGARLVLIGLTPFGATAFSLSQIGVDVRAESKLGAALPVPPENVLRDFHRAHFLAIDDPEFEGRSVRRDADGSVHITNAACGYEATFAPVRTEPTPAMR